MRYLYGLRAARRGRSPPRGCEANANLAEIGETDRILQDFEFFVKFALSH